MVQGVGNVHMVRRLRNFVFSVWPVETAHRRPHHAVARQLPRGGVRVPLVAAVLSCTPRPADPPAPSTSASVDQPEPADAIDPHPTEPHSATTASAAADPHPASIEPVEATPGRIQCSQRACDAATELCCAEGQPDGSAVGHCVQRTEATGTLGPCCPNGGAFCNNDGPTSERRCDDASDCPSGERCCAGDFGNGDIALDQCGSGCGEERCLPGSACPNGNLCDAQGLCPLQIAPPVCGAVTCAASQLCCYRSGGSPHCAAQCDSAETIFACTAPEQCAPHGCLNPAGSRYWGCGGAGPIAGVLCRTVADCPPQLPSLGATPGPGASACAASPGGLPTVKECQYE